MMRPDAHGRFKAGRIKAIAVSKAVRAITREAAAITRQLKQRQGGRRPDTDQLLTGFPRHYAPRGRTMAERALTSFKTELARIKAEFAQVEPKAGKLDSDDEQHLARWEIDDRAEDVWKTIQINAFGPIPCGPNPTFEPLDGFIVAVLLARRAADNIDNVYRQQRTRRARYLELAENAERFAKFYKTVLSEPPPIPSIAHKKVRLRAEIYESDAKMMRKLAGKAPKALRISREDRKGSRRRVAFMSSISEFISILCGKPLDNVVAILTDIAFPGREATSLEQVRSARRDTTRIERSKTRNGRSKGRNRRSKVRGASA
jgi:hypothetical protein